MRKLLDLFRRKPDPRIEQLMQRVYELEQQVISLHNALYPQATVRRLIRSPR